MKRIILVVALILCTLLLCTSCGKEVSPADFYENETFEAPYSFTSATKLDIGSDYEFIGGKDNILLFGYLDLEGDEPAVHYSVYDLAENKVVSTYKSTEEKVLEIELAEIFGVEVVVVEETVESDDDTVVTTTLYTPAGTSIVSAKDAALNYSDDYLDLFVFNDVIYRINADATATELCSTAFFSIPDFDFKTEDYYVSLDEDEITVYDANLSEVSYWEAPHGNIGEIGTTLLSDTSVLIQYMTQLPEDAKKFDIIEEGTKYDLVSIVYNFAKDKEKEVDLDFVGYGDATKARVLPYGDEDTFNYMKGIDNIVYIHYIDDNGNVLNDQNIVSLNAKNGKIKKVIAPDYDSFSMVAENRFMVTYKSGNKALIDENGDVIANLDSNVNGNGIYIRKGDKIYDYDLKLVYDLDAKEKEFVGFVGTNFIVSAEEDDEIKYYLVKDGAETLIADFADFEANYYVTESEEGACKFYAADGTLIQDFTDIDDYDEIYEAEKSVVIEVEVEDGKLSYYLFK